MPSAFVVCPTRMGRSRVGGAVLAAFLGGAGAISGCGGDVAIDTAGAPILFSPEGNRLNAYDTGAGFLKQTVMPSHADDPANGRDINGQVCFFRDGSRRFIAGEDTGQPNPPPGWGVFQLSGRRVGELSAIQIGKLTPVYQDPPGIPDNYGCGFLSDGRLLLSDIGNSESGPASGQLTIWFPPFDSPDPRACKLDTAIGTAGGIYVDEQDRVHVASARVTPGVYRYTGPFPTSADAAGGCGRIDNTGAPLADQVRKEKLIDVDGDNVVTPNAVIGSGRGTLYVSNVLNGVISEHDAAGRFIRRVLAPPRGAKLPYPTGSPMGLAVDASGTIYYADLGLTLRQGGLGPGRDLGGVRRVRFENGEPLPPETMDSALNFPDGLGVLN